MKKKDVLLTLAIGFSIALIISLILAAVLASDPSNHINFSEFFWSVFLFTSIVVVGFCFCAAISIVKVRKIKEKQLMDAKNSIRDAFNSRGMVESSRDSFGDFSFIVDETNKRIWFVNWSTGFWQFATFNLVKNCEVRIDGNVSRTTTNGGIKRAAVGYALAGGIGAVIGATTASTTTVTQNSSCELIIYLDDMSNPIIKFNFNGRYGIDFADRVYARLCVIVRNNIK